MWAIHHKDKWKELDEFEVSPIAGRRLDVGGFVLSDPFEIFLRNVSEDYLDQAWRRLSTTLEYYEIECPQDLSWGWFHPGETYIENHAKVSPIDLIGWSSQKLTDFDQDASFQGAFP